MLRQDTSAPRSIRACVISTSFPRFEGDVAGIFVRSFAEQLGELVDEVRVLAPSAGISQTSALSGSFHVERIAYGMHARLERSFYGRGIPDQILDPSRWKGLFSFPAAARRSSLWDNIDIAFCHFPLLTSFSVPHGIARVHVWHSSDVYALHRLPASAQQAIHSRADHHWFISPAHRDLANLPPGANANTLICPMLPALEASTSSFSGESNRLLSIGRLIKLKGVDRCLRSTKRSQSSIVIAGDGQLRQDLIRQANTYKVDALFVGHIAGKEKAHFFSSSSALLNLPRENGFRSDGFPTVLLEAASANLPIITSHSPAIEHFMEDEQTALIVKDEYEACQAISRLRQDKRFAKKMTQNAQTALAPLIDGRRFRNALLECLDLIES